MRNSIQFVLWHDAFYATQWISNFCSGENKENEMYFFRSREKVQTDLTKVRFQKRIKKVNSIDIFFFLWKVFFELEWAISLFFSFLFDSLEKLKILFFDNSMTKSGWKEKRNEIIIRFTFHNNNYTRLNCTFIRSRFFFLLFANFSFFFFFSQFIISFAVNAVGVLSKNVKNPATKSDHFHKYFPLVYFHFTGFNPCAVCQIAK